MKTYKVIKSFGMAKKGDIFVEMDNESGMYSMERTDEHKNGESKAWVSMEMSQDVINDLVYKGFMIQIVEEDNQNTSKLDELKNYVETLIENYSNDYKNLLEDFKNGDVQPCVKVEAETVYFNLIKVLNSIKNKFNE